MDVVVIIYIVLGILNSALSLYDRRRLLFVAFMLVLYPIFWLYFIWYALRIATVNNEVRVPRWRFDWAGGKQ